MAFLLLGCVTVIYASHSFDLKSRKLAGVDLSSLTDNVAVTFDHNGNVKTENDDEHNVDIKWSPEGTEVAVITNTKTGEITTVTFTPGNDSGSHGYNGDSGSHNY